MSVLIFISFILTILPLYVKKPPQIQGLCLMLKKKYDFIIPIGWGCLNAHNLRKNGLQRESLPFDWMFVSDISKIVIFLKTKFQHFLKKKDLLFVRHNGDADIYRDTFNQVEYWHDFMIGEDFDTAYEKNQKKYQRRIERLFHHIDRAQSVLLVRFERIFPDKQKTDTEYMFRNAPVKEEEIITNFNNLQALYPEKIFDLLLVQTWDQPRDFKEYDLTPHIHVCELYNDESLGWKGDEKTFKTILKPYDLTFESKLYYFANTLKYKFRKSYLQLLSLFFPAKKRTLKIKD